ncbi:thermonuclease family protein [Bradyrhizobium erythrophlei]|uniref:thermonuclease family protein n=1 Tax=Bradyrhizobium erythrophlei TaxID=1437360 RepID=UPI0035ED4E16
MTKRRALVLILLLLSSAALADDFVGQASVIDGDTLEFHGTRIRLWGVDAPESTQLCRGEDSLQYRCGSQAANDLDAYIARRPVNCVPLSLDRYGRTVATYSVAGRDLGEWLVSNGLALDWPQYSKGMGLFSATPSAPVGESGTGAMSSHGSIAPASAQTETRPPVRTMQMPFPDGLHCEASIHNA